MTAHVPACATDTEAIATGPRLIAAASATKAPASTTPATVARRRNWRGRTSPPVSSATGTTMTTVPSPPDRGQGEGRQRRGLGEEEKGAGEQGRGEQRPARAGRGARAAALAEGALRRPLDRRHQPSGHRQRQPDPGDRRQRLSEQDGGDRGEPAGQRAERRDHREIAGGQPLEERAQPEELEHAAGGGEPGGAPLLVAAGQPVDDERQRQEHGETDEHDPHERRPQRGRAHDATSR